MVCAWQFQLPYLVHWHIIQLVLGGMQSGEAEGSIQGLYQSWKTLTEPSQFSIPVLCIQMNNVTF